jgi:hypothetical protein
MPDTATNTSADVVVGSIVRYHYDLQHYEVREISRSRLGNHRKYRINGTWPIRNNTATTDHRWVSRSDITLIR